MISGVRIFYTSPSPAFESQLYPSTGMRTNPINFSPGSSMRPCDDPYAHVFLLPQLTYVTGRLPSDHYIVMCNRADAILFSLGHAPQNIMTAGELFVMALSTFARSAVLEDIAHG